jgi:hypothetical protein
MSLYYTPILTKRKGPKPVSKTAYKKALRDLKALAKDIRRTDAVLADALLVTVTAFDKLDKLEK